MFLPFPILDFAMLHKVNWPGLTWHKGNNRETALKLLNQLRLRSTEGSFAEVSLNVPEIYTNICVA